MLDKVKAILEDTCNVSININEYDAYLIKQLKSSNLVEERLNSNQSHIALTGNASFDFFPYVDIKSYAEDRRADMKSFYVLQVPVILNQKNIEYAERKISEIQFQNYEFEAGIIESNVSVKQSVRNNGSSRQLEFANTTTSSESFKKFRFLIKENDYLIILKRKHSLSYEAYIIKEEDKDDLTNTTEFIAPKSTTTYVNISQFKAENESKEVEKNLNHNQIYFGAPGTGKSYSVDKIVKQYYPNYEDSQSSDAKFVFRGTLHQEFSYSDFVGQILPKVEGESVKYEFVPGIFTLALETALNYSDKKIFLILEELSRANVASVFGDLFQLLDRKDSGESDYRISNPNISKYLHRYEWRDLDEDIQTQIANGKIYLPNNLYILCTVNTSDQNVNVMDTAFKRRFEWHFVSTDPQKDIDTDEFLNNKIITIEGVEIPWCEFYPKLNEFITDSMKLTEDKQIGQFFIKFTGDIQFDNQLIHNKLLQYLWEDVHNAAFGTVKLFHKDITSFSKLYKNYENGSVVFNNDFFGQFKRKDESNVTSSEKVMEIESLPTSEEFNF